MSKQAQSKSCALETTNLCGCHLVHGISLAKPEMLFPKGTITWTSGKDRFQDKAKRGQAHPVVLEIHCPFGMHGFPRFEWLHQDKQEPNDLRTAKRVVESIEDNLTEEDPAVHRCRWALGRSEPLKVDMSRQSSGSAKDL